MSAALRPPDGRLLACALTLAVLSAGCSMKRMVAGQVGNALASGGEVYSREEDPDLVREAVPFGLKTVESLLEIVPRHRGLLLAACQGFAQYGFAFVENDADRLAATDRQAAEAMRDRALKLYLRALDYGLRGLETRHKGIRARLQSAPETAMASLDKRDLPLLYWTAAAWGSAISLGRDRPELTVDLGVVMVMIRRALAIDETYEGGAIHEAMIVLEALPEFMGGSPERARTHFRRAVELSHDEKPTPYVLLASTVSIAKQDRAEFETLLQRAIAIDPNLRPVSRLEAIVMQRRAAMLLERADDLFLEPVPADADTLPDEESR